MKSVEVALKLGWDGALSLGKLHEGPNEALFAYLVNTGYAAGFNGQSLHISDPAWATALAGWKAEGKFGSIALGVSIWHIGGMSSAARKEVDFITFGLVPEYPLQQLATLLARVADLNLPIVYRPFNSAINPSWYVSDAAYSAQYGLPLYNPAHELMCLEAALSVAKQQNIALHITGIGTPRGVETYLRWKELGVSLSLDIALPSLLTSLDATVPYDSVYHQVPALVNEKERDALLAFVYAGKADRLVTNSVFTELEYKQCEYDASHPGAMVYEGLAEQLSELESTHGKLDLTSLFSPPPYGVKRATELQAAPAEVSMFATTHLFGPQITA
jgi:dihydroorotase-like cyclic amidohydrolase